MSSGDFFSHALYDCDGVGGGGCGGCGGSLVLSVDVEIVSGGDGLRRDQKPIEETTEDAHED